MWRHAYTGLRKPAPGRPTAPSPSSWALTLAHKAAIYASTDHA